MKKAFALVRTIEDTLLTPQDTRVRALVDPHGTLPDVGIHVHQKVEFPGFYIQEEAHILHAGQKIGWCDLAAEHGELMHFDYITLDTAVRLQGSDEVPRRERPKGVGLATYVIAIETSHERGLPFHSQEGELTHASNHVWEILVEYGVADVLESPQPIDKGGLQRVLASYRANPQ